MSAIRALWASVAVALAALAVGCGGGGEREAAPEPTTSELAVRQGDPEAGKAIFERQGCGNCHTFKAVGAHREVGPNLDLVAATYDAEFIRESIVDPLAYIETGNDGRIGNTSDPYASNMPPTGPDAEIEANRITEQELADLVAFLTERATPR